MTEVAWAPVNLSDTMRILRAKGATQGAVDAAGRVHRMRAAIETLRSEAAPLPAWLRSRPSQLAAFYALLGNWFDDRCLLLEAHDLDYLGGQ